ncbi:MAG TPA: hypothetical protein H9682_00520, partial [Firmicutes bacterium]|nr:hypothetical protein [Bacillota bacterium]
MFKHVTAGRKTMRPVRRTVAFVSMMVLTVGAASAIASAKAVYIIDDGTTRTTVESSDYAPSSVVKKAGIEVASSDQITSDRNEDGTVEIKITRGQNVSVNYMGATLHTYAHDETIA